MKIISQKTVDFYGDEITAVQDGKGTVYVPVRPICNLLGIAWSSQRRRINRDAILSELLTSVTVTVTEAGQRGNVLCLPVDYLNGWLFGINADRVKPEIREKLLRYQRDCYRVLAEAFLDNRVTHRPEPDFDELLKTDSPTAQAYKMIMAMAQMARQQLVIEARVESAETGIASNRDEIALLGSRVQELESGETTVTRQVDEAQASRISQAVKAIGYELGKRSGRNEFGGVYGELYRRFEITSYKMLPAAKFDETMQFLTNWYTSITNGEVPF